MVYERFFLCLASLFVFRSSFVCLMSSHLIFVLASIGLTFAAGLGAYNRPLLTLVQLVSLFKVDRGVLDTSARGLRCPRG